MTATRHITPCLWVDGHAEAMVRQYTRLFPAARSLGVARYGKEGTEHHGQPEGTVLTAEMEFDGYRVTALNGGPMFKLNPSISFYTHRETEAEVDALWAELAEGGEVLMPLGPYPWNARYGWLNDRFGVSWQVAMGSRARIGQAIAPMLMFTGEQSGKAEEAIQLYTSIFPESSVAGILRHDGSGPDKVGTVMHAQFSLAGETFMAIDSAYHAFGFNEAASLSISCKDQCEVDHYWSALTAGGGAESMCGWLKDRFGVSWQVVPEVVPRVVAGPDRAGAGRLMRALLGMRKLDVAALESAARGG